MAHKERETTKERDIEKKLRHCVFKKVKSVKFNFVFKNREERERQKQRNGGRQLSLWFFNEQRKCEKE